MMDVSRRGFLALSGLAAAGAALPVGAAAAAPRRPNIVLFLVDDMGWQDTSLAFYYKDGKPVKTTLNRRYKTPNMERLASEGMLFTDAYAHAICSPTRCSLMSGMNAARHRVTDWTLSVDDATRAQIHGEGLFPPVWSVNGVQPAGTKPQGRCVPPWKLNAQKKFYQPGLQDAAEKRPYRLNLPYTCVKGLPQFLREAGYYTIHCGKAHFGSGGYNWNTDKGMASPGADPRKFGFDVNIGGTDVGGPGNYRGCRHYGAGGNKQQGSRFGTPGLDINGYYENDVFLTDALTDRALQEVDGCLKAKPGAPFFLYMSHYVVHAPLHNDVAWDHDRSDAQMPAEDKQNPNPNDGLPWTPNERNYCTMVRGMDDSLGRILEFLKARGLEDNTLVIFMADNGGNDCSRVLRTKSFGSNAPLRAGKGSCYEGGTREPLIARWPGKIKAGTVSSEPVIIEDFFPTLLDAAGTDIAHLKGLAVTPAGTFKGEGPLRQVIDGETFLPVLLGKRKTVRTDGRDRAFLWHYPNRWGEGWEGREYYFYTAIRRGDWKLIYQHSRAKNTPRFELYNLREDISESKNLAEAEPARVENLRRLMGSLLRERGAQMPFRDAKRTHRVEWPDEGPLH